MKKGLLLGSLLMLALAVNAQTSESERAHEQVDKYRIITNKFWNNWFASVGGGAQIHFSDHDKQMKLGDRIAPALSFNIGKWFTPGVGVRVGMTGWKLYGLAGWDNLSITPSPGWSSYHGFIKGAERVNGQIVGGTVYTGRQHSYPLYETEIKYLHAHGDVLFNLSNLLFGYNSTRFYSFIPYVGVGLAWTQNKSVDGARSREITGNVGLLNEFRLSKSFSLQLDVRGTVVDDRFDQQNGNRVYDGILSATLGLTYYFPTKTYKISTKAWDSPEGQTVEIVKEVDLTPLYTRINDLEVENAKLRDNSKIVEVEKECGQLFLLLANVNFDFDKHDITAESGKLLDQAAEILKKMPERRFLISGFTDAWGSAKYNEGLSARRAAAVVQALEERGVPTDMLKSRGVGKKATTLPTTATEKQREGDRKVTIELILNMEYWDVLPKKSY